MATSLNSQSNHGFHGSNHQWQSYPTNTEFYATGHRVVYIQVKAHSETSYKLLQKLGTVSKNAEHEQKEFF